MDTRTSREEENDIRTSTKMRTIAKSDVKENNGSREKTNMYEAPVHTLVPLPDTYRECPTSIVGFTES